MQLISLSLIVHLKQQSNVSFQHQPKAARLWFNASKVINKSHKYQYSSCFILCERLITLLLAIKISQTQAKRSLGSILMAWSRYMELGAYVPVANSCSFEFARTACVKAITAHCGAWPPFFHKHTSVLHYGQIYHYTTIGLNSTIS